MIGEKIMADIILVSGGFDPIHSGHIKLINEANKYGDVVVLLNSDQWLRNKKGKEFLPFGERKIIMQNLKGVLDVIEFDDSDTTCVDGIEKAKSIYKDRIIKFANGGDRNDNTTPGPEQEFVIKMILKHYLVLVENNKSNSSSWILKNGKKNN